MPLQLRNLVLAPGEPESTLMLKAARRLSIDESRFISFQLVRKGLDARNKRNIHYVCTVRFELSDEQELSARFGDDPDLCVLDVDETHTFPRLQTNERIVIVGAGPAGLFTALRLAEYGISATMIERGRPVEERLKDVQRFWSTGELDTESNVQFGEGGAGTFSDGKLTTRVNDPHIRYVLRKLVDFGAPPEIACLAKPHIGTDRLRNVVRNIREYLTGSGFLVRFGSRLTDVVLHEGRVAAIRVNECGELPCGILVMAPGHSARDTYELLLRLGVRLEAKPFAVGVRIEHPQELINRIQYGRAADRNLPPADYSLAWNNRQTGRSCYSFCMCPGGVVVASASETGGVVTNGMSAYQRNAPYANSALVVNVKIEDFASPHPLAGVDFQRSLEKQAFVAGGGGYKAPAQNLAAFMGKEAKRAFSSYRPGISESDLNSFLPGFVTETLREGVTAFDRKMRGFITAEATLIGTETRTSAPVRIMRRADFQSISVSGLYPAGEGAGYAGGIMSAALDGIRVADAIARQLQAKGNRLMAEG